MGQLFQIAALWIGLTLIGGCNKHEEKPQDDPSESAQPAETEQPPPAANKAPSSPEESRAEKPDQIELSFVAKDDDSSPENVKIRVLEFETDEQASFDGESQIPWSTAKVMGQREIYKLPRSASGPKVVYLLVQAFDEKGLASSPKKIKVEVPAKVGDEPPADDLPPGVVPNDRFSFDPPRDATPERSEVDEGDFADPSRPVGPSTVNVIDSGNFSLEGELNHVQVEITKKGTRGFVFVSLHDDENASVEAVENYLESNEGTLIELKHSGERNVTFKLDEKDCTFDPNRIFSAEGINATLAKLSPAPCDKIKARPKVKNLADQLEALFKKIPEDQPIVAVHNNTNEGGLSIRSYQKSGSEYIAGNSQEVSVSGKDLDDFFLVTRYEDFDHFKQRGFNVALQSFAPTEDGSLSVWANSQRDRQGLPRRYINVEAEQDQKDRQLEMLQALNNLPSLSTSSTPQLLTANGSRANNFVRLSDIDPTIKQEMRYASNYNFLGHRVDGYWVSECILTRTTAEALKTVQKHLQEQRPAKSLKVYDCYRPQTSVDQFVRWGNLPEQKMKEHFFPNVEKNKLFLGGYIGSPSRHSDGNTVDLTIVQSPYNLVPIWQEQGGNCTVPLNRSNDNTLDMGTAYDCFDPKSKLGDTSISNDQTANRRTLLNAMKDVGGFSEYQGEWWHFSLKTDESGADPAKRPVRVY